MIDLLFNFFGYFLITNLILYKKGENSFSRWIKRRINKNLNFFAGFLGATGIGKSWASISLAYSIDPDFEVRQIVFTFKQLMEVINADWFKKKKWKIIIFEELQISISNRAWQQLINRLFNYLISTFRHQNIILFFNSPYLDFLDSQTLKLVHAKFDVLGHSNKTQLTHIRPKILQYNAERKKYYYHFLQVMHRGQKGAKKLENMYVTKPPKHLIEPYEKAKTDFTASLNKDIQAQLNKIDAVEDASVEGRKPFNRVSIQPLIWEYFKGGYKDYQEISDKLSEIKGKIISKPQISTNMLSMERKGWVIPRKTDN